MCFMCMLHENKNLSFNVNLNHSGFGTYYTIYDHNDYKNVLSKVLSLGFVNPKYQSTENKVFVFIPEHMIGKDMEWVHNWFRWYSLMIKEEVFATAIGLE